MIKVIAKIMVIIGAVLCLFPVFVIVVGCLMGNSELTSLIGSIFGANEGYASWRLLPLYPTLKNIVELLLDTPEYYVLFWNSVKVVAFIIVGQLVFAVPAAWGIARLKGRKGRVLYGLYIFCMLLPFQVTMLSQYIVLNKVNLINTLWSLIIPMVFSTFPVFIIYNNFERLPKEVVEAAKIDGANNFQVFARVGVPIAREGIMAAMILSFLEYWNMVEQPVVFIKDKEKWLLSIYIPEFGADNIGRAFAFSLFSILPAIIVFILGRNALENGFSVEGGSVND